MFLKAVALLLAVFLTVGRTGIMGGPREVDENREDVQNALKFAVTQHNKASNDVFLSQVSRVIKAQTQVGELNRCTRDRDHQQNTPWSSCILNVSLVPEDTLPRPPRHEPFSILPNLPQSLLFSTD